MGVRPSAGATVSPDGRTPLQLTLAIIGAAIIVQPILWLVFYSFLILKHSELFHLPNCQLQIFSLVKIKQYKFYQ